MSHYGDDPGQGNLHAISRFADVQRSRSDSLGTVKHDLIVLVNSVREHGWIGDTADAWKFRVRRQYPSIEAAADLARHWASAAESYHASVERLHRHAQAANEEIWNATHVLNGLSHVPAEYMTPATQAQIQHYEDQRYSAHGKLNTLAIEREHVDAAFAAALRNHTSAGEATNWTALSQLYAGAATAADIAKAREELLAENLDRARKIISTGALDSETADLTSFLAAAANDPEIAGQFWLGVGGDDALDLLEGGLRRLTDPNGGGFVDPDAADLGLDFGRAIRDSLAAGSTRWTEDEARDFAARMLTGQDWPGDTGVRRGNLAGVGFLFDDAGHHPMGESFTTATADIFDSWERGEGTPGEVGGSTRLDPMDADGAFNALVLADQLERGDAYGSNVGDGYGAPILDPMSRVLDTLGTYPNAAWEWLSADGATLPDGSPAMTTDKVGYWSSRDWSADGWDGFGSLWDGSMRADGGIAADGYTHQTWNGQCDVASRIIQGLDAGGHLTVGSLSADGGASMGDAVGHLMPFAEFQRWSDQSSPEPGDGQVVGSDAPAGQDPTRAMPYLSLNDFGDVVASIVSDDGGFAAIRTSVTQVEGALLQHANEAGTYEAWDDALSRYAHLEASFEGAVGGADVLRARMDDAANRQRMQIVDFGTSFLPGSGLPGAVGPRADFGIGQGVSGFTGSLTDQLANNEQMELAQLPLSEAAGAAGVNSRIAAMDSNPNLSLGSVEPTEKSRDTWLGTFSSDHHDGFYTSVWKGTDNV